MRATRDRSGKYLAVISYRCAWNMHTKRNTHSIYQLSIANLSCSSIAWAQLTLASSPDHEVALDALYDVFYGDGSSAEPELATRKKAERHRPWTPHNSFAYDNPEGTVLTTAAAFEAVARYPTLLTEERDVAAISLWDTNGKMGDWRCLERITF